MLMAPFSIQINWKHITYPKQTQWKHLVYKKFIINYVKNSPKNQTSLNPLLQYRLIHVQLLPTTHQIPLHPNHLCFVLSLSMLFPSSYPYFVTHHYHLCSCLHVFSFSLLIYSRPSHIHFKWYIHCTSPGTCLLTISVSNYCCFKTYLWANSRGTLETPTST